MRLSRRPQFFALVAVVGVLLMAATPREFWGVNCFVAGLGTFWAVALGIEEIAVQQRNRKREKP